MPKPTLPQGTRDFNAETVRKRNYIFNTIRTVFELYGFEPLETPAMENLETLMGKYGDEGDKLIFKILNNGLSDPKNIDKSKLAFENILQGKNDPNLTERALRYDLTIPFARYVAMNFGQLTLPYKRYQMQPVWRADRPQKGRYREFYQCDADLVGSNSLLSDVEVINIYISAFDKLKIPKFRYSLDSRGYFIKINNRKILTALAEVCECPEKLTEITSTIDKLDKIGIDKVKEELFQRGLKDYQVNIVNDYLSITGKENENILSQLRQLLGNNANGKKGIEELEFIIDHIPAEDFIEIDASLARGLNYYTGLIVEVKMPHEFSIGSIGGGGRYDNLTALFGVPNIAGVGISFGVDRIYDVMEELKLFPENIYAGTKILFFNLGEAESKTAFLLMQQLRNNNIACELFHENAKFDKQFKYADKKNIPYAIIIGNKELEEKTCNIKNLKTGEQQTINQSELTQFIFS